MGKGTNPFSDRVRFGDLSKEERKAVTKTAHKDVMGASFENTHICNPEIVAMLGCFKEHAWSPEPCQPQIEALYACVDEHHADPDPKVLARKWQSALRAQVFRLFAARKLHR